MKQSIKVQFDYDFSLIAIVAPLKDYRLSSFINKALNLQLVRVDDVINQYDKLHDDATFSRYIADDEENEMSFDLISNKNENGPLIKEQKEVDYFLIVQGGKSAEQCKYIIERINNIQYVQLAFELDVNDLKSKQNLILE